MHLIPTVEYTELSQLPVVEQGALAWKAAGVDRLCMIGREKVFKHPSFAEIRRLLAPAHILAGLKLHSFCGTLEDVDDWRRLAAAVRTCRAETGYDHILIDAETALLHADRAGREAIEAIDWMSVRQGFEQLPPDCVYYWGPIAAPRSPEKAEVWRYAWEAAHAGLQHVRFYDGMCGYKSHSTNEHVHEQYSDLFANLHDPKAEFLPMMYTDITETNHSWFSPSELHQALAGQTMEGHDVFVHLGQSVWKRAASVIKPW